MSEARRLYGLSLLAVALVVTVWLGLTGRLVLYIHPRYVVFTVVMALIGLVVVLGSLAYRPAHGHDARPGRFAVGRVLSVVAAGLSLAIAATLLILPPATLSAATATQRDIGNSSVGADAQSVAGASSSSRATFARFTVLDWSSLLRQTSDIAFYTGKPASVVGFVTPNGSDANSFFLSRFVITCCAVDAQPVAVPVYLENWRAKYPVDTWVAIAGAFTTNPSRAAPQPIALLPRSIGVVAQPSEPYLY